MDLAYLKTLNQKQLYDLARQHNIPVHHKHPAEKIIKEIIDHVFNKSATENKPAGEPVAPKPAVFNSREDVEKSLAKIRETKPDFESIYSENDTVVTFRYKGTEECHNMSTPMSVLMRRASYVAKGRFALKGYDVREWGAIAQGKNSYTNTVLS